ncbi:phage tail tube protein [Photobacterium damselae]|uniref:phage tail tube protein n=1 Tax=Photobacterium damselae TaxID=38293 RepID=UPI000D662E95|nr:phage tail tube protein [Photobacterium damselae]AWK84472.1 phage tail protein [Photobacterium damselae]
MGMILGEVTIRVNGKEVKTKGGATFNPGGYTRTSHMGPGRVWGKSRKYSPPSIDLTIAADEDVDVIEINSWENATLVWEGDNGVDYMMTNSATKEPASLSEDSGDIKATFEGDKATRI